MKLLQSIFPFQVSAKGRKFFLFEFVHDLFLGHAINLALLLSIQPILHLLHLVPILVGEVR